MLLRAGGILNHVDPLAKANLEHLGNMMHIYLIVQKYHVNYITTLFMVVHLV